MRTRAIAAGLTFGALVALLSGCVVFQGPVKVKQKGDKPKAVVKFTICGSDGPKSSCTSSGNSGFGPGLGDWRLLIGLRYSRGAEAPATIEPTSVDYGGGTGVTATVLARNAFYTAELREKAPGNPSKYKWVGYSSQPFTVDDEVSAGATAKFRIKLELKDKLIGEKLKVRPVVGSYQVSDAQPASDPIECGPDPFEPSSPQGPAYNDEVWRICIDSPAPDKFTNAKVKIER